MDSLSTPWVTWRGGHIRYRRGTGLPGILGGQLVSQGLGKIKLWPFFFPLCHSDNETGLYMYVYKYIVYIKYYNHI